MNPADLAQMQLEAYNKRDIEAFLVPYSEDVACYNHPNDLILQGKNAMRERYAKLFSESPELHCQLVNRIEMGRFVFDHELVRGRLKGPEIQAVAIYEILNHQIKNVWFLRGS